MLLFRSEEDVKAWAQRRHMQPGAIFDLRQLWRLARMWYDDRLDRRWRRRTIGERQSILDEAGLHGAFWNLKHPGARDGLS